MSESERFSEAVSDAIESTKAVGERQEALEVLTREFPDLTAEDIESLLENAQEGADDDSDVIAQAAFEKLDAANRLKAAVEKGTDPMDPGAREAAADLAESMDDEDVTANKVIDAVQNIRQAEDREADKAAQKAREVFRRELGVSEKGWVPYQGPRGGSGWKNTDSGDVTYSDDPPGGMDGDALVEMEESVRDAMLQSGGDDLREAYEEATGEDAAGMDEEDMAREMTDNMSDHELAGLAQSLGVSPGAAAEDESDGDGDGDGAWSDDYGEEPSEEDLQAFKDSLGEDLRDEYSEQYDMQELADQHGVTEDDVMDVLAEDAYRSGLEGDRTMPDPDEFRDMADAELGGGGSDTGDGGDGGGPDTSDMPMWDSLGDELMDEYREDYETQELAESYGVSKEEVMQVFEDTAQRRGERGDRTAPSPEEFRDMVHEEFGDGGGEPSNEEINMAADAITNEVRGNTDEVTYDLVSEVVSSDRFADVDADRTELVNEVAEVFGVGRDQEGEEKSWLDEASEKAGGFVDERRGLKGGDNPSDDGAREKSWVPYDGPQGGTGYRNIDTGDVHYGDDPPGDTIDPEDLSEDDIESLAEQADASVEEVREAVQEEVANEGGEEDGLDGDGGEGGAPHNPDALPEDLSDASAADMEDALGEAYYEPGEEGQMGPDEVADAWDRMGASGDPPDWLADGAYPGDLAMDMTRGSGAGEPSTEQVNDAAAVVADEVGGASNATYDDVSEVVSSDRFAGTNVDSSQLVDEVAEQLGVGRDQDDGGSDGDWSPPESMDDHSLLSAMEIAGVDDSSDLEDDQAVEEMMDAYRQTSADEDTDREDLEQAAEELAKQAADMGLWALKARMSHAVRSSVGR